MIKGKGSQWMESVKRNAFVRDPRIWTGILAVVIVIAMVGSWAAQGGVSAGAGLFNAGLNIEHGTIGSAGALEYKAPLHSSGGVSFSSLAQSSAGTSTGTFAATSTATYAASAKSAQRMVIEQASLNITLPEVRKAEARIAQLAVGDGGFVASSQESTGGGNALMATMTVRVPKARFSSFLAQARTLGTVTYFSQTGQDVTQQYTGLLQHIAELRSEAAAYTRLYSKAQSMRDMLQIEQSLAQVNSQISDLSSQKHNLSRSVQLATVNLTFTTTTFSSSAPPPIVTLWNQFISTLGLSALSVFTLIAWAFPWVLLFLLIVLFGRGWTRRKK
ncbi:MAG: DUF4349 domain-containing protein [Bacilli bacterium]